MDFGLSEDQNLLVETLHGFLGDRVPITRVRELRDLDCPNDRAIWAELAELGMTGVMIPEADGGSGLGLLDAALVSWCLGGAATPAPFVSSSVMVPAALAGLEGDAVRGWFGGIADGTLTFGLGVTESFSIREGAGVALRDGRLHGKAMMAMDACHADRILLAVGPDRLAVIRADASGVERSKLATIDTTRCFSELVLDAVEAEAVFEDAAERIERMLVAGRIALAADTLGACEAMIEQAVDYAKERKQFERVIGSFQSVKHLCAEMIAELEPTRSLLWYAAHSFDAIPEDAPLMACHVLAHASEIGREIASVSTQVHGGIGWTDEQNLHFWFKRIASARHMLGGPEALRGRAAELQGLAAAS